MIKNKITFAGKALLHHIRHIEEMRDAIYTLSFKPRLVNRLPFDRLTHRQQVTVTFTLSIK